MRPTIAVTTQVWNAARRSRLFRKTASGVRGRMIKAAWIMGMATNSSLGMVRRELSKRLVATCPQGTTSAQSKAKIYKIRERQLMSAP
jgi:hypothetical protein